MDDMATVVFGLENLHSVFGPVCQTAHSSSPTLSPKSTPNGFIRPVLWDDTADMSANQVIGWESARTHNFKPGACCVKG